MNKGEQSKAALLVGGLIVIIIALVLGSTYWKSAQAPTEEKAAAVNKAKVVTKKTNTPEAPLTNTAPATQPTPTLSYEDALKAYTGYLLQFRNCSAGGGGFSNSASLNVKAGTKFMLDNRDATSHTFVVGSSTYYIGGMNFAVVSAKDVGTFNITCDGGGSATLHVQP